MSRITQETFDAAVRENIEEFEMSQEEAIADAVQQFEAQGVDLSNVVRDLSLQDKTKEGNTQHKVINALEELDTLLKADTLNKDQLKESCKTIQEECDIDLAHRCLASSKNAYNLLFDALQKVRDDQDLFLVVLNAMCSLCDGQPDVLDLRGTMYIAEAMKDSSLNKDCVFALVRLVHLTCVMHEHNRQAYIEKGIITALVQVIENHSDRADIVKAVCQALKTLTLDDDVRVPFGKAHEHAKMIVTEANALQVILKISKEYADDMSVLGEMFLTLSCLAVRNEFCQEITDLGGLMLILDALENSMTQKTIVVDALKVLKAIAGNDKVKIEIVRANGVPLILSAITKHQKQPVICQLGCAAIATIVLRNIEHCQITMASHAAETLVKVLTLHPDHAGAQKAACMAIRNLVARTRDYTSDFVNLGVEPLLQRTLATHDCCHDEAKAALRDLGLKVELKVRWTGEGKGIAR